MVEKETKEETKEEMVWIPDPPVCPKCGYPHAQPPECVACGQKLKEKPEEPEEKPEGETSEGKPEDELLKKSRDELNALADEKGLDHDDYRNKEEIAKAILESD